MSTEPTHNPTQVHFWEMSSHRKDAEALDEADTPNNETISAMTEATEIASGKRKTKSYKNAKAMFKDILDD
ncbi:hypothetical protein [Fibrobacter succinogenes]|uniref:Uncharacterized protein n=1 Tax=Fibrobacter succinogenes TaxID=833 RepID=A0A380S6H2_FIBSU|nr:hypothetical protein [Fibrobacter succinogenes]PWJ34696.1 hypothetical protein IE02_2233 [Fibrobacter succinogenes subsp. elongatus]SUQ24819.1 hypothetical protein SAMN05661053_2233 [Fibrobacter succinogenes]